MWLAAICKQDAATAVTMVLEKRKQKWKGKNTLFLIVWLGKWNIHQDRCDFSYNSNTSVKTSTTACLWSYPDKPKHRPVCCKHYILTGIVLFNYLIFLEINDRICLVNKGFNRTVLVTLLRGNEAKQWSNSDRIQGRRVSPSANITVTPPCHRKKSVLALSYAPC